MAKKTRATSIELIRFVAAAVVMTYHFFTIYISGDGIIIYAYVFVEFFFMLSGFFMMKHVTERDDPMDPAAYVFRKAASFYPIYIIAFSFQFVLFVLMNHLKSAPEVLGRLFHFKWEALLLQNAGFIPDPQFNTDYLLGQAWYLSAMLLAMVIAYPLARYFRKVYLSIVCPLMIIVVYSYIMQTLGTLNIGNEYFGVVMSAIVRGLAGTCVGSLCYAGYVHIKEHPFKGKKAAVIEIACYASVIGLLFLRGEFTSDADSLFFILVFALILIFAFVNETPVSVFLNTHGVKVLTYLGSLSLYLYLLHWSVMSAMQLWLPDMGEVTGAVVFYGGTLMLSVLLKWYNDRRKSAAGIGVIAGVSLAAALAAPYIV